MAILSNAFTLFLSLIVEAMPFLLLGVLLSSLLSIFIDEKWLVARMPQQPLLGALVGGCIGFLFPVCECGNVPVARRLIIQGVPISVAVGFLLAAPTVNPIVIWSTWLAFRDRPELVILRVVFSLLIATLVGWLFGTQTDPKPILQPAVALALPRQTALGSAGSLLDGGDFLIGGNGVATQKMTADLIATPKRSLRANVRLTLDNVVRELRELGGVLILGSAIAAAVQTLAPRELIVGLGQGSILSIVVMMVLAASISICSTVDSFFALSFASAFTSGSLLAFLVFGPMFDIKSIGLMLSIFKLKPIVYIMAIVAQLTFFLTLFINFNVS
jgi:uncharacterized protein